MEMIHHDCKISLARQPSWQGILVMQQIDPEVSGLVLNKNAASPRDCMKEEIQGMLNLQIASQL